MIRHANQSLRLNDFAIVTGHTRIGMTHDESSRHRVEDFFCNRPEGMPEGIESDPRTFEIELVEELCELLPNSIRTYSLMRSLT